MHPKEFYKDYKGILVTDGLEQYHKLDRELEGVTNANCWAHARRDYADALKAFGKDNVKAVKNAIAYQALARISTIYKLEGTLKDLSADERLKERQTSIKPLVEEYFTWVKERLNDTDCLPKMYRLIIQPLSAASEPFVLARRTGCLLIRLKEPRPVR